MSCTINSIASYPKLSEFIRNKVGNNDLQFGTIALAINDEKFPEYFKSKTGKDLVLDESSSSKTPNVSIYKQAKEFYNSLYPDVHESVNEQRVTDVELSIGNFSSVTERKYCADRFAKFIAAKYVANTREGVQDKWTPLQYFDSVITEVIIPEIDGRINDKIKKLQNAISKEKDAKKKETLQKRLDKINAAKFDESSSVAKRRINALSIMANDQDKALLAMYRQAITKNSRDAWFDEVYRRKETSMIHSKREGELEDYTDDSSNTVNEEDNNGNTEKPEEDVRDNSLGALTNHDGMYKNFMQHVDGFMNAYFASLYKLSSTSQNDFDLNNPLGMPDTMDTKTCANMMFTFGNFNNVDDMIASVLAIAENQPGMQAFAKFALDMQNDRSFAYHVYNIFGKTIISKLETVYDGENATSRISNKTANRNSYLLFGYMNDIRHTALHVNSEVVKNHAEQAKTIVDRINNNKANLANWESILGEIESGHVSPRIRAIVSNIEGDPKDHINSEISKLTTDIKVDRANLKKIIFEELNQYYSDVTEGAISNYLLNHKNEGNPNNNFETNASYLIDRIIATADASIETKANYSTMMSKVSAIRKKNRELQENYIAELSANPTGKVKKPVLTDPTDIFKQGYVAKKNESEAIALTDALVNYSLVKTDLNSRNVHGNLSSDVINNNMLGNLKRLVESLGDNVKAEEFAKFKFGGNQYNLSNILIETPHNKGLFKYENGKYVVTDYATKLLQVNLFNGANNSSNNNQAVYSEMSPGDYTATAFANFFNCEQDIEGITFANYFTRINSDAPKIFSIRAPRYSVSNLYTVNYTDETRRELNNLVDSHLRILAKETVSNYEESLQNVEGNKIDEASFFNYIVGEDFADITINELSTREDPDQGTIGYVRLVNEANPSESIYIAGTYDKKSHTLSNIKFEGFAVDQAQFDKGNAGFNVGKYRRKLENYFETQQLKNGTVKLQMNSTSAVYRQFEDIFMQELTDMAAALEYMFEMIPKNGTRGFIQMKDGKLVFKNGIANSGIAINKLYDRYYHNGKEIVDKNGKLTGKVFTSDKFVVAYPDGTVRNFGQEILDSGLFDLFQTDPNSPNFLHYTMNGNKVQVYLTDEQKALFHSKLQEFIGQYLIRGRERMTAYADFIPENLYDNEHIDEFLLNHHLMYVSFNELMEGDAKFYKSSQDFLKRSKEIQGSGTPFGNTDYARNFSYDFKEDANGSLSKLGLQTYYVDPSTGVLKQTPILDHTCFRCVTVKNSQRERPINTDELIKALMDSGLTLDQAETLILGPKELDKKTGEYVRRGGYQGTKINDAQSYITFDEWVRRIYYRGDYPKYEPLIKKLMDPNAELTDADITDFVQVQKDFYYDLYNDPITGLVVPRQIKNAEYVLVPRFIQGTELEVVYNLMMDNGIDQLNTIETSKAANHNVLTLWNKDGFLEDTSEFEANAKAARENYNYNYLYIQQKTPQHMDAENKAGIQIMKKILDNIPEGNRKMQALKKEFIDLYCANIKDSYQDLMSDLEIPLDEKGNIKFEEYNINGQTYKRFPKLNTSKMYEKLREEAIRKGVDSNTLDYITLDEATGLPKMPSYMGTLSFTFENLAQSIFTNRIARQKLPGFHAAQVSSVGFVQYDKNHVQKSDKLKYHPNGESYIEVLIPKPEALKDLSDEEALALLQGAGYDKMIGYRIPTEGKQSVAVMKVVGFLDKAQGSTIVVPHDWVSQTGSDFDIDSVYTIWKDIRLNKDGKLVKVEYYGGSKEDDVRTRYVNYVKSKLSKEDRNILFDYIKGIVSKEDVKKLTKSRRNYLREQGKEIRDVYWDVKDAVEHIKLEELTKKLDELATTNYNLMSFEQFSKLSIPEQNTRDARNNQITDDMIRILQDPSTLEENLSRSNFDDITDAMKAVRTPAENAIKSARSPYNFLDQAEFQNDVMGGAKLKAFSVTRDTFLSICNTVKPVLGKDHVLKVYYDNSDLTKEQYEEKYRVLKERYDTVEKAPGGFIITHKRFGWSGDNRNIADKLITPYSSQTTAHILDAVKEGAATNVNDLTFGVYKTFPDLGIDYLTTLSFMAQPGIRRIVSAYNRNKSIYGNSRDRNFVHTAIREIAKDLGINADKSVRIDDIMTEINDKYGAQLMMQFQTFGEFDFSLKKDGRANIANLVFNAKNQLGRINREDEYRKNNSTPPVEDLLYDLGIVLQYYKLQFTAKDISDMARVCNPDKFGAKQTIYETNKVFEDIQTILDSDKAETLTLEDGTPLLQAIYPDVEKGFEAFVTSTRDDSKYKPLHYMLKYVTGVSIGINRQLFEHTQSVPFRNLVNSLQTDIEGHMTEKLYLDFQRYILKEKCYADARIVKQAIEVDDNGNIVVATESDKEAEKQRVYGYGYSSDYSFEVDDIHNPSTGVLQEFAKLTPGQKIDWIKHHYRDAGIFNYIEVNLNNEDELKRTGATKHRITFPDSTMDIDTALDEFNVCFNNNDKLVKLAAIDLIKYAVQVEGMKMRKNNISQVIDDDVLLRPLEDNGTSFVLDSDNAIMSIQNMRPEAAAELREMYIRSHPNMTQLPSIMNRRVKDARGEHWEIRDDNANGYNIIKLPLELANKTGFITDYDSNKGTYKVNTFVRFGRYGKRHLYKVIGKGTMIYAYPMIELEEDEVGTFSANENNNSYNGLPLFDKSFYETIIDADFKGETLLSDAKEKNKELEAQHKYINTYKVTGNTDISFDINNPPVGYESRFQHVIEAIDKRGENLGEINGPNQIFVIADIAGKQKGLLKSDSVINVHGTWYDLVRVDNKALLRDYVHTFDKNGKFVPLNTKKLEELNNGDEILRAYIEEARSVQAKSSNNYYPQRNLYSISKTIFANDLVQSESDENVEDTNDIMASTVNSFVRSVVVDMNRRATVGKNPNASEFIRNLQKKAILVKNLDTTTGHEKDILSYHTKFLMDVERDVKYVAEHYMADPENPLHFFSIDSPEVLKRVNEDQMFRNEFLKFILDVASFRDKLAVLQDIQLTPEEESLQKDIDNISNLIGKIINNSSVNKAFSMFMSDYLAKNSTNPLIKNNIIGVDNGFNSLSWFESWITDIQEAGMPLIQIVTKEVMADIRGKEMTAQVRARQEDKFFKEVTKRATAAGQTINWNHIFTKDGRFIPQYTDKLIEDLNHHRATINKYEKSTIERLKAEHEFKKWKLKHINQVLNDDYYKREIEYEDNMLNNAPIIYSAYKKLTNERSLILSFVSSDGTLDDAHQQQLDEINLKIANLLSDRDENGEPKLSYEELTGTHEERVLASAGAAKMLRDYLEQTKALRNEYFKQEPKEGFDLALDKYLKELRRAERRDANNHIQEYDDNLANDEKYQEARKWLLNNARFVVPQEITDEINDAYKKLKKRKAYVGSNIKRIVAKYPGCRDVYGAIDGSKITDPKDRELLKQEQLDQWDATTSSFSDKALISNAGQDNVVYTRDFYAGMTTGAPKNSEYMAVVRQINDILRTVYDSKNKIVVTSDLTIDQLDILDDLYDKLDNIRPRHKSSKAIGEAVHNFIESNVDFVTNESAFNTEYNKANIDRVTKGEDWYKAWVKVNGSSVDESNSHLYSFVKPKDEVLDKFTDKEMTSATNTLRTYIQYIPTNYYWSEVEKWQKYINEKGITSTEKANRVAEYKKWYDENHIYNPNTHRIQPIKIWMRSDYIGDAADSENWEPTFNQTISSPKEGKENSNYKADVPMEMNYKANPGDEYYVQDEANDFEKEIRNHLIELFKEIGKTSKAKKYFNKGFVPMLHKPNKRNAKFYAKEAAKSFGLYTDKPKNNWNLDVDYSTDYEVPMPMLGRFDKEKYKEYPSRDGMSQAEYEAAYDAVEKENEEIRKRNIKANEDAAYNNWEEVIHNFIIEAGHYNAVQENKLMLFYGLEALKKMPVKRHRSMSKELIRNTKLSTPTNEQFHEAPNENAANLMRNQIRRIVYDQYKEYAGDWTRVGSTLQAMSSAKFMMMNITGGIANVTYGKTQIAMETFAGEYWDNKDYISGMSDYYKGVPSYMAGMGKETASSLEDGLIKMFSILEFDSLEGLDNPDKVGAEIEKYRNYAYAPQTAGEHMMQNGAMLVMMKSHRLYKDNEGKWHIGSLGNYTENLEEKALLEVIGNNQELLNTYHAFKAEIKRDPNKTKDYATFRKFLEYDFAIGYLTKAQQKEFIKKKKDIKEKAKKEFKTFDTLKSQFKLGDDGYVTFAPGSIFATDEQFLGKEEDVYKMLGAFKGKVISVNKKIHGVYDRLGGARIETKWWGGIIMQYHKHLYPGIMKRYRSSAYWNEERQTVEKGQVQSWQDFLRIPFDKVNDDIKKKNNGSISLSDVMCAESVQNYCKSVIEFVSNWNLYYDLLPESERANIHRQYGDLCGVGAAIFTSIAMNMWDDDDKDNMLRYLCLYEADRLASESAMYTPWGLYSEGEKLWSTPVAAEGSIKDLMSSMKVLGHLMMDDEYNENYTTGLYAGENRLNVLWQRQIPIWRGINMIRHLDKNYRYYKLGQNALGFINTEAIADELKGKNVKNTVSL